MLSLLAALAAGCGGDGTITITSSGKPRQIYEVKAVTTVTTGSLGKREFLIRASTMCRHRQEIINHRLELLREETRPDANQRKLLAEAAQSTLLPGIQFVFDDLRVIGSPEGDERQLEEMVGAFQHAVETGQSEEVPTARKFARLFRDFNHFARIYGLDQCTIEQSHYQPVWEVSRAASQQRG